MMNCQNTGVYTNRPEQSLASMTTRLKDPDSKRKSLTNEKNGIVTPASGARDTTTSMSASTHQTDLSSETPKFKRKKSREKEQAYDLPPPPKRRKKATEDEQENDYFCWICHKDGSVICCELCPRVYHVKCINLEAQPEGEWVDPECEKSMVAECVETQSASMKMLTLDQRCMLFKYALQRMKQQAPEQFHQPVTPDVEPTYRDYIVHPMDISLLEKNIRKKMYGSPEAFHSDAKWILHNCIIFNGPQHKLTAAARQMLRICRHEMNEIDVCPDCYLSSCTKKENWFCEPCRTPHVLVWAKLKGFPYWPAKALRVNNGLVDVRFFGQHDRAWVPMSQCFLLSKEIPCAMGKKRKQGFDASMDELRHHIRRIEEKVGPFKYDGFREAFDPNQMFLKIERKTVMNGTSSTKQPQLSPLKGKAVIVTSAGKVLPAQVCSRVPEPENVQIKIEKQSPVKTSRSVNLTIKISKPPDTSNDLDQHLSNNNNTNSKLQVSAENSLTLKHRILASTQKDNEKSKAETVLSNATKQDYVPKEIDNPAQDDEVKRTDNASDATRVTAENEGRNVQSVEQESTGDNMSSITEKPKNVKLVETIEQCKLSLGLEDSVDIEENSIAFEHDGSETDESDSANKIEAKTDESNEHKTDMDSSMSEPFTSSTSDKSATDLDIMESEPIRKDISAKSITDSESATERMETIPPVDNLLPDKTKCKNLPESGKVEHDKSKDKIEMAAMPIESCDGKIDNTKNGNNLPNCDGILVSDIELDSTKSKSVENKIVIDINEVNVEPTSNAVKTDNKSPDTSADEPMIIAVKNTLKKGKTARKSTRSSRKISLNASENFLKESDSEAAQKANVESSAGPWQKVSVIDSANVMLVGDNATKMSSPLQPSVAIVQPSGGGSITYKSPTSNVVHIQPAASAPSRIPPHTLRYVYPSTNRGTAVSVPGIVSSSKGSTFLTNSAPLNLSSKPGTGVVPQKYVDKISKSLKEVMQEMHNDITETITKQQEAKQTSQLPLEMEKLNWRHQQELAEIKHNIELTLVEMRQSFELEKKTAIQNMERQMQDGFRAGELERRKEIDQLRKETNKEIEKAVNETKKKQWCANCGKEAIFYCCWNTSYCDYSCQQLHWPTHMNSCTQMQQQELSGDGKGSSTDTATSDKASSPDSAIESLKATVQKHTSEARQSSPAQVIANSAPQTSGQVVYGQYVPFSQFNTYGQPPYASPQLRTMGHTVVPGSGLVYPVLRAQNASAMQGGHIIVPSGIRPPMYQPTRY